MTKEDFQVEATQFCFDNGINITPYQAGKIAEHFYNQGYTAGFMSGVDSEKNPWDK